MSTTTASSEKKSFVQKNLTGVLWKNERKKEAKHPDETGSLTIDGQKYNLSSYINESKDGKIYRSLYVTLDDGTRSKGKGTTTEAEAQAKTQSDEKSEDLPF